MIVGAEAEADFVRCELAKSARDTGGVVFLCAGLLIDVRRAEADIAVAGGEDEIARIEVSAGSLEAQCDLIGIGAGSDVEVVFELLLIAVIDEINTRIDALVFNARVLWNAGAPFRWLVSDEVIALAGSCSAP